MTAGARYLRLLLTVFLVLTASAAASTAASAARPFSTGVTVSDVGGQEQLGFDRIRAAGASYTRITVFWSLVAPKFRPASWNPADPSDSHYDWQVNDTQVQQAVSAGLRPLVQVYSAPRWAERCKAPTAGICNPDPGEFAKFSAAVAKRYSGGFQGLPRVRYFEPLNEPNLYTHFMPQFKNGRKVSPDLYRNLLNRFSAVVKKVDPDNVVVAGGLAPLGGKGALSPLDFARRVLCMKGRSHPKRDRGCDNTARFDVWATNPYTTGGPTHESVNVDDVQLGDLPEMSKLLKSAKSAGRIRTGLNRVGFWVTEFSWDSSPPDPGGLPMGLLTRWTSEAMFRSWQAGVSNFFWLTLRDWPRDGWLPYSQTVEGGLYFRGSNLAEDRPKRVLKAFRFPFVAFRKSNGISIWGRTPDSTAGKVSISYKLSGGWKSLGKVRADAHGVFSSKVRTRLGRGFRGSVRAEFEGAKSPAFSLRPVPDRYQAPFG